MFQPKDEEQCAQVQQEKKEMQKHSKRNKADDPNTELYFLFFFR